MLLPKTILGGQIFLVAILQAQHHWFELFNWCLSGQVLCFLLLSQFLWKFRSFVTVELTWELAREGAVWDVLHTFTCFHWNGLDFPFSSNIYWSHTSQTLFSNFWLCCINCRCQPGNFFPLTIQCSVQYNQEEKDKMLQFNEIQFLPPTNWKECKKGQISFSPRCLQKFVLYSTEEVYKVLLEREL